MKTIYCISLFLFFTGLLSNTWAVELKPSAESEEVDGIEDSSNNAKTGRVYGSWLFNGGFGDTEFTGINPSYRISQGDTLLVQLWGGIDVQETLVVDAQGNVFIPKVGPVRVLGVENKRLNEVVLKSIKRVYKSNVDAYITLASSQKIKVFLTGMVESPGLYEGQSADSILRFIDQAGGIRKALGSYRSVEIKRNSEVIQRVDLYSFLSDGNIGNTQLQDGDVIFVGRKNGEVTIEGEVGFTGSYELSEGMNYLGQIVQAVVQREKATHVTVVQPVGGQINATQYPITQIDKILVRPGALLKVSSQLRPTSISVEVAGEHNSQSEIVLPWGATLKDLLDQVEYSPLSNQQAIKLYRKSVAQRQKETLDASLTALEQSVLTARSGTNETAKLRKAEAEIVLQWVEKARKVQPQGQVVLSKGYDPSAIILKQDDRIVIPQYKNLVMVHGEVWFPATFSYESGKSIRKYVAQAGGLTADEDDMNILVMKPNGSFLSANGEVKNKAFIEPGDEIFVLAKPQIKSIQLTKDITQVIYQVAVSAAVVLAL